MVRDINTIEYLPEFVREFREIQIVTAVEDKELVSINQDVETVKKNQFIMSTDCTGISRFEKLLGIVPSKSESLESRQLKVLSKWRDDIPYTYKWLVEKLDELCGMGNYVVKCEFDKYKLEIVLVKPKSEDVIYLVKVLEQHIPCNILNVVTKENEVSNMMYVANVLKMRKDVKVVRKGLITGVGGGVCTAIVVSVVKNIKIGMGSGSYGEL